MLQNLSVKIYFDIFIQNDSRRMQRKCITTFSTHNHTNKIHEKRV